MATKKQCDRCGGLEDERIRGGGVKTVTFATERKFFVQRWENIDLCIHCLEEFMEFKKPVSPPKD